MIVKTVTFNDFYNEFKAYDRLDNFSYEGLVALYEYLENLYEDLGETYELDVIELCCEFTEYESFEELQVDYPSIEDFDDLHNYTPVIEFDGGVIIVDF